MPAYFTAAFQQFFKDLSRNNDTTWFNENKKRYEQDVKNPFISFIEALIKEASKLDGSIKIEAKEAITRINRDIRFSVDKSPYKLHVSAIVSAKGKKGKEYPGVYIELGPEKIMIYGGAYMLEKEVLRNTRLYILKNLKAFEKIIKDKKFVEAFGEVQGEKNKVLPPEIKTHIDKQPLLANKNFYYFAELPYQELTSSTLLTTVMKYYKAGHDLNQFLIKAMA